MQSLHELSSNRFYVCLKIQNKLLCLQERISKVTDVAWFELLKSPIYWFTITSTFLLFWSTFDNRDSVFSVSSLSVVIKVPFSFIQSRFTSSKEWDSERQHRKRKGCKSGNRSQRYWLNHPKATRWTSKDSQ